MKSIDELSAEYPHLFANANSHFPDGWETLITHMLNMLANWSWHDDKKDRAVTYLDFVQVNQVKEKFGGLRFYYTIINDPTDHLGESKVATVRQFVFGAVSFTEYLSYRTCQECGAAGDGRSYGGWYVTLCNEHHEQELKRRK